MAKELKPRSQSNNNEPYDRPHIGNDDGGSIAELDYQPEASRSEQFVPDKQNGIQTPDVESISADNGVQEGGAKWNEDGSGWMADKLENAGKSGVKGVFSDSNGDSDESESEDESQNEDSTIDGADGAADGEQFEDGDGSVESQNSVSNDPVGIDVDNSDDGGDRQTLMERTKSFAKNSLTQNRVSKGVSSVVKSGMGMLTGAGLSTGIAGVVLASAAVLSVATIGVAGAAIVASNNVRLDETVIKASDCSDEDAYAKLAASMSGQDGANDTNALKQDVINKIYSVLKKRGYSDIHIAGVLGNFETESSNDPAIYEGNYTHSYTLSEAQQKLVGDANKLHNYAQNVLFPMYNQDNVNYNPSAYMVDGKYTVGLGLGQLTGGRTKLLLDWSKENNMNWWEVDTQLIFMFVADDPARVKYVSEDYQNKSFSSPEDAAYDFSKYWEGNVTNGMSERSKHSASYYVKIKEMTFDKSYAKSIIAKIGTSVSSAAKNKASSTKEAADECNDVKSSYGGSGWQAKGGVYSGNTGGWQAWRYDKLPDELKQYAIDPSSLGMKYGSDEGWSIGAGNYLSSGINDQCTTLSSALMGVLWEKNGKPLGTTPGLSGNGDQLVDQMSSNMGTKVRKEPVSGDLVSTGTYNHTQVVSHVFENGDILVIEQNITNYSGSQNGESYSWSYQYVTKSTYEKDRYIFTSPEEKGYTISSKAKSVG